MSSTSSGYRQDALDAVERTLADDFETRELGLHSGLAGIGLNLLHFAAEPALQAKAIRVIDLVADRLGDVDRRTGAQWRGASAGRADVRLVRSGAAVPAGVRAVR